MKFLVSSKTLHKELSTIDFEKELIRDINIVGDSIFIETDCKTIMICGQKSNKEGRLAVATYQWNKLNEAIKFIDDQPITLDFGQDNDKLSVRFEF